MSTLQLGPELKTLFDDITSGKQDASSVRAIMVQNENGTLQMVTTLPESSTDKEDFSTVLGKLFAKEPSKPGYALYRLDSKSPAGLCEWINCAYRPEGAKVREKMQYTLTQTSLFKALDEQHFLETVYGGSVSEFSFPTKLRNQRKHDYQNPQQSISGKKAAEAAGTGTAGRRNFDKIPTPSTLPQRKSTGTNDTTSVATDDKPLTPTPVQQQESTAEENSSVRPAREVVEASPSSPSPSASVPEQSEPPAQPVKEIPEEEVVTEPHQDPKEGEISAPPLEAKEPEEEMRTSGRDIEAPSVEKEEPRLTEEKSVDESVKEHAPLSALSALSGDSEKQESEQEDIMEQSIAPSSYAELREDAIESEPSQPALETVAEEPNATNTATETKAKPSTTSVGMGTSSQGLETERERHLTHLKGEEEKLKSSSKQGGSHIGFAWQDDVEPALHGLAKLRGGTSEWNLVVLKIDLSKEEIELASEPRFVLPGDFSEVLPDDEPCYAFYSHPAVQSESDESSQIVVIYVCPLHSSVRQRMLYSANLATTSNRVSDIQGLTILKRIETSDPRELTASFFNEELLGEASNEAGQAKAFSRPKRPGRK